MYFEINFLQETCLIFFERMYTKMQWDPDLLANAYKLLDSNASYKE